MPYVCSSVLFKNCVFLTAHEMSLIWVMIKHQYQLKTIVSRFVNRYSQPTMADLATQLWHI